MIKKGFSMKIFPGMEKEYKRRHEKIWPEMVKILKKHKVESYSIFLDEETLTLFAYVEIKEEYLWNKISETEECKKWWKYMADIMETNENYSPKSKNLKQVFQLN